MTEMIANNRAGSVAPASAAPAHIALAKPKVRSWADVAPTVLHLSKVCDTTHLAVKTLYGGDSYCVMAVAALVTYLRGEGYNANPLTVGVHIDNPAKAAMHKKNLNLSSDSQRRWAIKNGAWAIGIGTGDMPAPTVSKGRWDGHLVCEVNLGADYGSLILDPTITQANRLDKGIRLQPLTFWLDEMPHLEVNGSWVIYSPRRYDMSYKTAGIDYQNPDPMLIGAIKRGVEGL